MKTGKSGQSSFALSVQKLMGPPPPDAPQNLEEFQPCPKSKPPGSNDAQSKPDGEAPR